MVPRRPYPTDLSDAEWELLAPLIPAPKPGGRPIVHERRKIMNALAYWVRPGCARRLLPINPPKPWRRASLPSWSLAINQTWCIAAAIGCDLLAWFSLLCCEAELAIAEPSTLC